jgi:hypothetical protein
VICIRIVSSFVRYVQSTTSTVEAYMIVLIISILQLICIFFFLGNPVYAQTTQSANQSFDLSTQTSDWYEVNYPAHEANFWEFEPNTLTALIDRGSRRSMLIPHHHQFPPDTADNWPEYTFSFDFRHTQGADINFLFHYRDERNWYEMHIKYGTYQIVRVQDGQVTFRVFGNIDLQKDLWQHIKMQINTGEYSLFLDDELIGSHSDWTYDDGSPGIVGLRATTGAIFPTQVSFRNLQVTLSTEPNQQTNVMPHYKQTDPLWAQDEYDTAELWSSNPTMYRWGCLTTSMAMIFQFYGVPVTPQSLNDWLKSQPDGYIGNGLFNWVAATRLSRLYNQELGTPKLEYSVALGPDLNAATHELSNDRPVIYQLPGHFLVGNSTQTILDPFYDFKTLQEHTLYQEKGLLSTRILTPSNTDLSYFVFVHNAGLKIQLHNSEGVEIPLVTTHDWLTAPPDHTEQSTNQVLSMFAKPSSGEYFLSFTANTPTKEEIEILTYDIHAEPTQTQFTAWATPNVSQIKIEYEKENNLPTQNPTTIQLLVSVDTLVESILLFENQNVPWHVATFLSYLHTALTNTKISDLFKIELAQKILTIFETCLPPEIFDFWQTNLQFALSSELVSTFE